jgi:hypothetical protein
MKQRAPWLPVYASSSREQVHKNLSEILRKGTQTKKLVFIQILKRQYMIKINVFSDKDQSQSETPNH